MKYACLTILFIPCNEILSLLALLIMMVMLICDMVAARERQK